MNIKTMISRNDNCVWRIVNDEVAILIPNSNALHILNEVGSMIWQLASEPIEVAAIVSTVAEEYEADFETITADVVDFVQMLKEKEFFVEGTAV